jgi:hypothetical protein
MDTLVAAMVIVDVVAVKRMRFWVPRVEPRIPRVDARSCRSGRRLWSATEPSCVFPLAGNDDDGDGDEATLTVHIPDFILFVTALF